MSRWKSSDLSSFPVVEIVDGVEIVVHHGAGPRRRIAAGLATQIVDMQMAARRTMLLVGTLFVFTEHDVERIGLRDGGGDGTSHHIDIEGSANVDVQPDLERRIVRLDLLGVPDAALGRGEFDSRSVVSHQVFHIGWGSAARTWVQG